jgi:hypothetical protein
VLLWIHHHPTTLTGTKLAGDRRTHGPVCLDLAVDFSGSMVQEAPTRDAALAALRPFIPANLQPDDILASAAFAQQAELSLPPTRKDELAGAPVSTSGPTSGTETYLVPALRTLRSAYEAQHITCAAHALIVITDVELADLPAVISDELASMNLQRVYWAMPVRDDGDRPGLAGEKELRSVEARGFDDADGLSLLYGEALATLTGQELVRS